MDTALLRALAEHRPSIRAQWEKLLRLDRGTTALARPDTLVHLIDATLDEVYAKLPAWSARRQAYRPPEPVCPCGRSPFLAYFACGRQALHEGLVTVQASRPGLTPPDRDEAFARLDQVFSRIARREIESFCSVCQFHPLPEGRYQSAPGAASCRMPASLPASR